MQTTDATITFPWDDATITVKSDHYKLACDLLAANISAADEGRLPYPHPNIPFADPGTATLRDLEAAGVQDRDRARLLVLADRARGDDPSSRHFQWRPTPCQEAAS